MTKKTADDLVQGFLGRLRQNRLFAPIIIVGIIFLALAGVFIATFDVIDRVSSLFAPEKPAVRGDSDDAQSPQERDGLLSDNLPIHFNVNDPNIRGVKKINLRTEVGSVAYVGNCPQEPCFLLIYKGINIPHDPPLVTIAIGGRWGGSDFGTSGFRWEVPIKRGCGFVIRTGVVDCYFEVVSENISEIEAWVGMRNSSVPVGLITIDEFECDYYKELKKIWTDSVRQADSISSIDR